jgi:Na+/melibiose symporter-like transporter
MVEVGIAEYFGIGEALGIIGTMFVVLCFSRKHMEKLTEDVQTKVLNDLDEKVRKMAEIIIKNHRCKKSYGLILILRFS